MRFFLRKNQKKLNLEKSQNLRLFSEKNAFILSKGILNKNWWTENMQVVVNRLVLFSPKQTY